MNLFQKLYLDYVNNFLTVERFAEYHQMTKDQALYVLEEGKRFHEQEVKNLKEVSK